MNFIKAVIEISKRKDLELCEDENELNGKYSSICVYKKGEFIGKLRWPYLDYKLKDKRHALVDRTIEKELQNESN